MTEKAALREVKKIVNGSITKQTSGQFDEYTVDVIQGEYTITVMRKELEELIEKIYRDLTLNK